MLSTSKSPVILLSGDVHFAELSEMVCTNKSNVNGEKHHRVLEFTSSGLTHAWAGPLNWPKPMPAPLLFRSFYYLWAMIGIHPWRVHAYPGLNFGEIEMSDDKHVIMRAIGVDNKTKTLQNNQSQVQLDKINPLSYVHKTKHTYIHRKQIHIYIYCFSP